MVGGGVAACHLVHCTSRQPLHVKVLLSAAISGTGQTFDPSPAEYRQELPWQVDLVDVSPTNRQRQWETLRCRPTSAAASSAAGLDTGDSASPAVGVSGITSAQARYHSPKDYSTMLHA